MTIPETMRAVVLTGHGDLDKLEVHQDWPTPKPNDGEVLIKVAACGMNNTDVNTRSGWYSSDVRSETGGETITGNTGAAPAWGGKPVTFPRIQGADVIGVVVAAGPGVSDALIGKRVMIDSWLRDWEHPHDLNRCGYYGSEADGGYAEYTKVDHRQVHPVESPLSDAELATFATSYITAENMLEKAKVTENDTVLITGASGGVGGALVQLANRRGATTIALASAEKHQDVAKLNPNHILDRAPNDLKAALKSAIGSETVSVVADVVGGDYWPTLIEAIARNGRYTCSGAIAGPIVEFDLRTFYLGDLTFTGATITPPDLFANLVRYIERGEILPALAATYKLEDIHAAQTAFMEKRHTGNIVLTMD